ncbi:hypothetical protein RRG08_044403 [Elysia crispata]|uniref:Uncharacterized protein n=1 Tax=Elysia crispata TaxID=231223 RepID=A0AAE0ZUS3_9GAST|nr:hypothetical protein RRG08_044403 [Elysia crispata]
MTRTGTHDFLHGQIQRLTYRPRSKDPAILYTRSPLSPRPHYVMALYDIVFATSAAAATGDRSRQRKQRH